MTVRIAVHAVRRIPGGTVLDWSVTPLSARRASDHGDPVPPSFNLGLSRFGEDTVNIFLIDSQRGRLYRPLTRSARGLPAVPVHTRPAGAARRSGSARPPCSRSPIAGCRSTSPTVDVDIATVPIFGRRPVTPDRDGPAARSVRPTSPGRPIRDPGRRHRTLPLPAAAASGSRSGSTRSRPGGTFTSLAWTDHLAECGSGLEAGRRPTVRRRPSPPISVQRRRRPAGRVLESVDGRRLRARLDQAELADVAAGLGVPVHRSAGVADVHAAAPAGRRRWSPTCRRCRADRDLGLGVDPGRR